MRDLFLLDPDVVFLNHGSYGACPRPVFAEYQRFQRELERNPVEFLGRDRRFPELHDTARDDLARYVGADPGNLVFVPNATTGMNVVASALELAPGDEVVITDHEYGAIDLLWRVVCARTGARLVRVAVPVPPADVAETVLGAITTRTRAVVVSHITSPTALVFPVEELCGRAREIGVLTVIDGAHAPGQIPLRLEELGADFYAGNCHKWLCAPKGAGFLYARPKHHSRLDPPVLSWDFEADGFGERHRYQGTRDPASYLAVPAAIRFQAEHDWGDLQARCHQLAERVRLSLADLTGLAPLSGENGFVQMIAAELPPGDAAAVQQRLRDEHRIEVPVREWNGRILIRVSVQAYNDAADVDALLEALPTLL